VAVTYEEAPFAVTLTLVHLRERQSDLSHTTEFTSAHYVTR